MSAKRIDFSPETATPAAGDQSVSQLIAYIVAHYHEGHRRELPGLVRLAVELGDGAAASELALRLSRLLPALELHMFMEEMRLFPMMTQGGHVLVGQLIEDMSAEHALHACDLARLRSLTVDACAAPKDSAAGARILQFLDEFAAHIAIEEDTLFPMFVAPVRS